jgi:hypothetical protein
LLACEVYTKIRGDAKRLDQKDSGFAEVQEEIKQKLETLHGCFPFLGNCAFSSHLFHSRTSNSGMEEKEKTLEVIRKCASEIGALIDDLTDDNSLKLDAFSKAIDVAGKAFSDEIKQSTFCFVSTLCFFPTLCSV